MSKQYPGGFIMANPTAPTLYSAPGIWTLDQAQQYIKAGTWPGGPDPYFPYTTLLLPGNGTNGAQNNTFLDSSTNNFTITRNGNTTQGTFAPYGANWSNYFDGSGDQLTAAANNAFVFGTGDFCIEGFFFVAADSTSNIATIVSNTAGGNNGWIFSYYTGGFRFQSTGVLLFQITSSLNTWHHVVICRASGTTSIFIDGVRQGTTSTAYTWSDNSTLNIGYRGADAYFTGYMSNVRLVKGSSVYDPSQTTITVPTAPLTAITNTSLLTCQSNRFIDNSTNNFTITKNGDVSVQVFSPFNPTAAYSAGTLGGSGYFDGTGDYLTAPSNSAFAFGTGDFTVEAWVYPQGTQFYNIIAATNSSGSLQAGRWWFEYSQTRGFAFVTGNTTYTQACTVVLNTWTHIAVTRSGTSLRFFLDGVQQGSTQTVSDDLNTTTTCGIGALAAGAQPFTGYISNLRIVKGTAVYTSNFTPPTSPLTAISNTSLLLNFINAGIIDNAMMNDLETVGNAQISTTQSKWGGSSIAFDGTGDWLLAPSSTNFQLLTANFTIEMWVYFNNTSGYALCDLRGVGTASVNNPAIFWSVSPNTSKVAAYLDNSERIVSGTLSTGQWYHVALVRSGTTANLYIDGTSAGTYTYSTSIAQQALYVGTGSGLTSFNGYIDDFRITKGYARYTANFTVPNGPFPTR